MPTFLNVFLKQVEKETGMPPSRQSFFKGGKMKVKYKKTVGRTFKKVGMVELRDKEGKMVPQPKKKMAPSDNQQELERKTEEQVESKEVAAPQPEEVEAPTTEMTEEEQLKLAMAMSMGEEQAEPKKEVEVSPPQPVEASLNFSTEAVAAQLAAIGSANVAAAAAPAPAVESTAAPESKANSISEAQIGEKVQKVLEQVPSADMNLILSMLQQNSYDVAAVITMLFESGMGMEEGLGLDDNDEPDKKDEMAQAGYAKAKKKAGVYHVKSRADYDRLLKSERLLCVKFSGQWCPPSRMVAPKIKSIAAHYPGMKFA